MKFVLASEKCTFFLGRYSQDEKRQHYLNHLASTCSLKLPAILMRNEQARVHSLTRSGARSIWQQTLFCTWTADAVGERKTDMLSKLIHSLGKSGRLLLDGVTGRISQRQEQVLSRLLMKAYTEGFIQWEMLFNTKAQLENTPMSDTELWSWLWGRFNKSPSRAIPQLLLLTEDKDRGVKLTEIQNSPKHSTTILITGEYGRSSCPEHRQCTNRVYVKDKVVGVLTMADTVAAWVSVREQILWMWKVLSESHVRDTEAIVEISAANRYLTEDNLHRQAKQTKAARERALLKGTGRDVGAEIKQEESFDAQKKLYKGAVPLNCAMIMQNISYRITGCITSNAVASFQKHLTYPSEIIAQNASESFFPHRKDLYSCWLIEKGGRFWQCRFYPSEMTLAAVATNQEERRARRALMARYPNTIKGQLQGLADFTKLYVAALKENRGVGEWEKGGVGEEKLINVNNA
ncbi:hypothetical protein NIES4071_14220 [Calothrix sp. NIES-4071]|nr:hypothetical protein NIES4071_14220 [Calothrix sp. NIES-4071]BAZ55760.1 hypothetical protein NIES4105_14170 [Calothrix sp. NIES-4105]